jgi:S-DNA-T family DNA segregation ATPase FtsK/SpoIIIE
LLPFSIFCGALGICTFLFRRRKPFSFLTFPLWILLFATANFFSGIQSGHAFPQLAYQRLLSDGKPLREAALWVVLLMIAELVVLVLLILLAKPLNAHYRKKQEFKAKQEAARLASQPEETAAPVLSKRQMRREEKRKAKEAKKLAKAAGKKGTSGDDVPEPGEERTTVVVPDRASREEALRFPSFMEVPKLDHLKRKNPEVPTEDPAPLQDSSPAQGASNPLGKGVVSLKTLEVIRDEVTRTNPIDPPPVAAADVKEKPVPRKTLSGFLQGALEAVGKAPKSQTKDSFRDTPRPSVMGKDSSSKRWRRTSASTRIWRRWDLRSPNRLRMSQSFRKPRLRHYSNRLLSCLPANRCSSRPPGRLIFPLPLPKSRPLHRLRWRCVRRSRSSR